MFEHKVTEEATQQASRDQQLVDFIELYARFKADAASCGATPQERFRMRQFEAKIDAAWRRIPEDKRAILVEALFVKKLLPEEIKTAIRMFNGKVARVT